MTRGSAARGRRGAGGRSIRTSSACSPAGAPVWSGDGPRILVVDDSAGVRQLLSAATLNGAGFEVEVAAVARDAMIAMANGANSTPWSSTTRCPGPTGSSWSARCGGRSPGPDRDGLRGRHPGGEASRLGGRGQRLSRQVRPPSGRPHQHPAPAHRPRGSGHRLRARSFSIGSRTRAAALTTNTSTRMPIRHT